MQTRQMMIRRYGLPNVFEHVETGLPDLRSNEVMIRVHFAGINFSDIMARMGMYPDAPALPMVPGYEVSGKVEEVGSKVKTIKVGYYVMALVRFGGYSGHVIVPGSQVRIIPKGVGLEQAAAFPVAYLTAHLMLYHMGNMKVDDTVLIHNAGGGVGLAAVQLANLKGTRIIATANRSKHERLKEMGVEHVIDYNSMDFAQEVVNYTDRRGVDIVLDAQGPSHFRRSYHLLAPLGKLIMYGVQASVGHKRNIFDILSLFLGAVAARYQPMEMMQKNRSVMGFNLGRLWDSQDRVTEAWKELLVWLEAGKITPVVDKTFNYMMTADAHSYIQAHQNFGKVLLNFQTLYE